MARPSLWLRALLMTNRFCIPMGARYARPSVSPWMNTDSKSTDIPYRPSKAPGITRRTTLLMIAYGGRDAGCGGECGEHGMPGRRDGQDETARAYPAAGLSAPPSPARPVHETEQARIVSRRGGGSEGVRERCFAIDSDWR